MAFGISFKRCQECRSPTAKVMACGWEIFLQAIGCAKPLVLIEAFTETMSGSIASISPVRSRFVLPEDLKIQKYMRRNILNDLCLRFSSGEL